MRCLLKKLGLLCGCIMLLPGCGRIVDYVKESFNQGQDLSDFSKIPRQFIRSVTVYDQFETLGMFDSLWLSDPVRIAYAQLHACKYGKSKEHEKAFLRRQIEENNHYIDFYVLSLYILPLDTDDSKWSLFLEVNCERYAPIEVKAIDLAQEYVFFFGKHLSRFKVPYLVRFSAFDVENKPLISRSTKEIHLVLRSVKKEAVLTWNFAQLQCIDIQTLHKSCCTKCCEAECHDSLSPDVGCPDESNCN